LKYPAKLQTAILRLLTYLLPASQIDLIPDTDTDSYVKQDGNQSGKRLFCDRLVLAHLTDLWFLAITNLWRGWFAPPPRLLRKASGGRCPSAPEIHHRSADVWYHRSGGSQWLIDIGGGAIIIITQNALILQLLGGGFAAQTTSEGSAPCTSTGSTAPDSLRPRYQHDLLDPPPGQASSRQFKNITSPLQRKSGHLDIKHMECLLQHSQLRECMGVL